MKIHFLLLALLAFVALSQHNVDARLHDPAIRRMTEHRLLDELLHRRMEALEEGGLGGEDNDEGFEGRRTSEEPTVGNTYLWQFTPSGINWYNGPPKMVNKYNLWVGWDWNGREYSGLHSRGNDNDWNTAGAHIVRCSTASPLGQTARSKGKAFAFGVPVGSKPMDGKACCSQRSRHSGGLTRRCCSPAGGSCNPRNPSGNKNRDCCAHTRCIENKNSYLGRYIVGTCR